VRQPLVRQDDFDYEDYPFLDPRYNKNIPSDDKLNITQTYWTDAFLYWLDDPEVVEGSFLAFFSDVKQESGVNTICFDSF